MERKIKAIDAINIAGETKVVNSKDFQEPLPGTNLFTARGDNPIWNPDEEQKAKNVKANPVYKTGEREFEESDDSSSDDEFVGVEDQEDFKGFKGRFEEEVFISAMKCGQFKFQFFSFLGHFFYWFKCSQ